MTYTHKLDKDKCECATKDMKDLHTFLYYYSYLFYVQVALTILLIIASVHLSLVIAEKKAEYEKDIDIARLASMLVVDGVVSGENLRDELVKRFDFYSSKTLSYFPRRHGVVPV